MMSNFAPAFASVLTHEGGYINHANDHGGATKYGISLRFLKSLAVNGDLNGDGHISQADISGMSQRQARDIYYQHFWLYYRVHKIVDQAIAAKVFNCFVNMRGYTAALMVQRAVNMLGFNLVEDGVLGSRSIQAINEVDPSHLMPCLQVKQWRVYQSIVDADPSQQVFLKGWARRAFAIV